MKSTQQLEVLMKYSENVFLHTGPFGFVVYNAWNIELSLS